MSEQDLKQLWKSQPAETAAFSTSELRARAQAFQRRIARRNLARSLAATVWGMWKSGGVFDRRLVAGEPAAIA